MTHCEEMQTVILRISELFRTAQLNNWHEVFIKFAKEVKTNPQLTRSQIISLFGGVGSLNDIILYINGQPLINENNELDELRSKLYLLCREA
ncbi:DUF6966 domain-containing protein [Massilia sp. PWRC2]|uniref:DUF6966 domain-containing protein n=1 Tax=Massilia sp. PWRC2 TaxID=2804626 RepID=UPI003CEBFC53